MSHRLYERPYGAKRFTPAPAVGSVPPRWSDGQEFFVEAAKAASPVDKVNLQNPVTFFARSVAIAHAIGILWMHVECDLVTRNTLVGELADQVPGDRPAEFPALPSGAKALIFIGRLRHG